MKHRTSYFVAALLLPVLAFGLPVLAVVCIGPRRGDTLIAWLEGIRFQPHAHAGGARVPSFSLIDQRGQPLTRESLQGCVWVASFFLSRCSGTCPMTSAKMAQLQRRVAEPAVKLVSFSMDPSHDTPDVLRGYAAHFDADPQRWHMLTGDAEQIRAVVTGLGLTERQRQRADKMVHSDCFVLIDIDGRARGFYDSGNPMEMEGLAADATALGRQRRRRSIGRGRCRFRRDGFSIALS